MRFNARAGSNYRPRDLSSSSISGLFVRVEVVYIYIYPGFYKAAVRDAAAVECNPGLAFGAAGNGTPRS